MFLGKLSIGNKIKGGGVGVCILVIGIKVFLKKMFDKYFFF